MNVCIVYALSVNFTIIIRIMVDVDEIVHYGTL